MHDGAPCHRLKVVSECFRKGKVEVFDWLENSPDLDPIKNLWTYMKSKVTEKQQSSAKKLVIAIKKVWVKEISSENCAFLVKSKPSRFAAVEQEKGGNTKY